MYAGFENKIVDDFPYIIENIEKTIDDNCPIEYYGIECADGWYNILYEYFDRVDRLFKKYNEKNNIRYSQIKEKFGTLRIKYYFLSKLSSDKLFNEIFYLTRKYELLSSIRCELCGKYGRRDWYNTYIQVLCNDCRKNKEDKND